MTGGCWKNSRAASSGWTAARPGGWIAASRISRAWRDEVLEQEEKEFHKLGRQIAREEDWLRYGVTARRKRNVRRVAGLGGAAPGQARA